MRSVARNFVILTRLDPFKALLLAWPVSIVVQTLLDAALAALVQAGMMFSPWQTCRALFAWLTGGDPLAFRFLYGQADIGLASLGLAGSLLVFEPLFWAGLAVLIIRLTAGRKIMA